MRRYKLGICMDTDQYKIWAASSSSQGLQKFDWKGMQRPSCISCLLRFEKSHAICREPARHEKTRDASSTAEGGRAACDSSKRSEQLSWISVLNNFANYSSCSSKKRCFVTRRDMRETFSFASRHVKKTASLPIGFRTSPPAK